MTASSLTWPLIPSSFGQTAPGAAVTTPAPTAPAEKPEREKKIPVETVKPEDKPAAVADDETIVMSPFEVTTSTRGYFASNSMSGTRFNSKVEDLASSLTIMTKEQMDDFAMLDINDVLHFTAGAEGTSTYTDFNIDRNGQLNDNVQIDPKNANRIRGILAANQSYGNFEVSRLQVDRIMTDGIEIGRGPNANVFGLGYAAGTVNQVPAAANLMRNKTRIDFRADSYEGYRSSFDVNQVLKHGVLALRVNGAFQHEGFVRKPSGMDTTRFNMYVKYQPFKNTTISASQLRFRTNGTRPNFTPPRDYITDWVNAGKPTWDPVLMVVHRNGETIDRFGPVGTRALAPITADTMFPVDVPFSRSNNSRNNVSVDRQGITYWTMPGTSNPLPASANQFIPSPLFAGQNVRTMQTNFFGGTNGKYSGQPLFSSAPSVGDHSYYDWGSINLSATNSEWENTDAYMAQIDQVVLNTPRQTLFVQGSFFRENSMQYKRQPLGNSGISGVTGQVFIDVNEKRLDGTPNPNLGRPYIAAGEFTTRYSPVDWDTFRAQFAYKLDLRNEKGWLKWLGMHQLTGYDEYKYRINRQWAYRETITSDHSWTGAQTMLAQNGVARGNQSGVPGGAVAGPNLIRSYYMHYIGDAGDQTFDYAPTPITHGQYPLVWGGYRTVYTATSIPGNANMAGAVDPSTGTFFTDMATLGFLPTTDQTGGVNNLKQIIKTPGFVIQSHFLDSKIVTTFGMRQDKVYSKNGPTLSTPQTPVGGANLLNNYTQHDWDYDNHWAFGDYRYNIGKTKTAGIVARPFRDLGFINRSASAHGLFSWIADGLRGLSLTYNVSDNFYPQAPAVDLFRRQLPNVTGEGKDYGFWMTFADNKLVIRFNHYITKQLNIRNGEANTIAQRVLRLDLDVSGDAFQLTDRAIGWNRTNFLLANPTRTLASITAAENAQFFAAALNQMQMPVEEYFALDTAFRGSGALAATNDFISRGNELEINYNPTRNWRLSASLTETKSFTTNVSSTIQEWIDKRMPVWTSLVDLNQTSNTINTGADAYWAPDAANPNHLWWLHRYNNGQSPFENYTSNVAAPYKVIKQQEGKSKPSVRRYNFKMATSLDLAAFSDNRYIKKIRVGANANWMDKGAIGYYGKQQLPAIITELDGDNPIYDKARLYVGAFVAYKTKLYRDKVVANFQFNVENLGENGRLQPIGAFPDGTPNAYRIVDPQKFILSMSFEL